MSMCTNEQQARCFENCLLKVSIIGSVGRSYLVCAEGFARGYAQSLADVGALSFEQRDELYALIEKAVEQRRRTR